MDNIPGTGTVLITGGTSGLGLHLTKIFLKNGFTVVAVGRRHINITGCGDKFRSVKADFSDLVGTARIIRELCRSLSFDLVINNAGILSPPRYTSTQDGFEYTFQVNFLSHVLINEIIISEKPDSLPLMIAAVTSPVYKLIKVVDNKFFEKKHYRSFGAYSYSKLYLAMMCCHFSEKYHDKKITCISFDPGVFRSGIYRMRSRFFGRLYRIAAPIMKNPEKVADALFSTLTGSNLTDQGIYDIRGNIIFLPEYDPRATALLWDKCYDAIGPLIKDPLMTGSSQRACK